MAYVDKVVSDNEIVIHRAKFHWFRMFSAILRCILISAFVTVCFSTAAFIFKSILGVENNEVIVWVATGTFVFCFVPAFIGWVILPKFSELALTDRRMVFSPGPWGESVELRLRSIEAVAIKRGLLGSIFGFGTVAVKSGGSTVISRSHVKNASNFKADIDAAIANSEM